jgi:PAS domain S-box-containing protein
MELDFKALYHHAPCGYVYTTEDGTLIEVNETFLAYTGYSRDDIIKNKRFDDFLSIGWKIYYETHFMPLLLMHGEASQITFDLIRKDETRFPVLVNATKHIASDQQHSYIQFIILDITQRKQYEMELLNAKRKSDELLEQLSNVNKELKSNIQEIEEQSQQLEELNATKDKFFSIVAHDLKSPLNSLKSFSSMLIDHLDNLNKDEILTMSKQIHDSVNNTIKMADNLITWAMLQMEDSKFNEEIIKVKEITSNIFDVYQKLALEKEINFSFMVDEELTIIGDKNQIEFVIRNLVNNAIKFTNKKGHVSLMAKSLTDGLVQISVSDNGVGIPDDIKCKLFSISNKQNTKGTEGEKGTGLGLMMSNEFMKLNGGQIGIESSLGKGSTFYIKFKSGPLQQF